MKQDGKTFTSPKGEQLQGYCWGSQAAALQTSFLISLV